jgi:hypothetical protein
MQLRKVIGALFIGVLCACSPTLGKGKVTQAESVAKEIIESSDAKGTTIEMESKNSFIQAAIDATEGSLGEVVAVESAPPTAVVIRYRKGDVTSSPSSCSVSIVEWDEGKGKGEVVATNNSILECSLALSVEEVKERAEVSVENDKISISGDGDKGGVEFDLYRESDGLWYVSRVSFTYPEEDSESGDVIVVKEVVSLQRAVRHLRFSDYSYDAIRGDLARTSVE